MKLAIPSTIALTIIAAITLFHNRVVPDKRAEIPLIPAVVAPAPVAVKPEPFAYADAVMPSFVPTPKPRPHRRHRPVCKPLIWR